MYLVTATHYLTGIAPGLLLLVPPLEIFFDLRPGEPAASAWQTWLLFYAGFYLMQIVLAFYTLGSFRWEVLMLAAVSFPIYISALWQRDRQARSRSGTSPAARRKPSRRSTSSSRRCWSSSSWSSPRSCRIWRDLGNSQLSLATAWNVTNTFILGAFMIVALQGELADQPPAEEPGARPGRAPDRRRADGPPHDGHRAAAAGRGARCLRAHRHRQHQLTTDDDDNEHVPADAHRAQHDNDAKEVAAK